MGEDFAAPLAWFRQGSVLAGYRLEAQVGAGGMAVVFRARDERLGRSVALKILAPALAADGAFRRRFVAESRAAAVVDDPHIIPIYEAGEADGALFIAMRFVLGGDLRQVLEREGVLPPDRTAEFISPVASALDAAHAAGLVHRDVKPANILVDARPGRPDHVYLSDFGVSKGATSSVSLTGTGQFLGTPDYSAPEQIQGRAVDGRTDQYALACVACQLLTGQVPFERDQGIAVLLAHLSEPPPALSSRRPDLPAAADQVLARALAKAPEKRYATCGDFADALRDALGLAPYHRHRSPAPDHPPTVVTSQPEIPEPITDEAAKAAVPADLAADATIDSLPVEDKASVAAARQPGQRPPSIPGSGGGVARSRHPGRLLAIALAVAAVAAAAIITPLLLASSPSAGSPSSVRLMSTLTYPGTSTVAFSVAYSPNGATLATAGANHNGSSAYLWNIATGKVIANFTDPSGVGVNAVAFSPDGTTLATGDVDGDAYLWNVATGALAATITDPGGVSVSSVAFSPDGASLAVGDDNGSTYLWNVAARTLTATFTGRSGPAGGNSVAFGPGGATLATSDGNGHGAYLWNVAARTLTATLTAPAGPRISSITSVALSPNGATLAAGDADGKTYLWNVATHTLTATLTDPLSVDKVAFSPNGATLAVGDANASTYLWNVATRTLTATLTHTLGTSVQSLAFSPNGANLAVMLGGGTADLWAIS